MVTSIQYQLSNVILPQDVLSGDFNGFHEQILMQGRLQDYLNFMWHRLPAIVPDEFSLRDTDKEVTPQSFDVQVIADELHQFSAYVIEFPDYEYRDAACKYVAIVFSEKIDPCYFTLEYSEHFLTHSPCFVVGKWEVVNDRLAHVNLGTIESCDKKEFLSIIWNYVKDNIIE